MTHAEPPPEALAWAACAAGGDLRVASCRALAGPSFHANHVLGLVGDSGSTRELVLRRWAGAGWELTDAEFHARREAAILELLERSPVPAARLVAADPDGAHCRVPALLTTFLPGRPPSPSLPRAVLLEGLADALSAIHTVESAEGSVPTYRRYHQPPDLELPAWARDRGLWKTAVELASGPPPNLPDGFIHRDFHPGNTLWEGRRLTGVVDWSYGSRGPAAIDAAHLRACCPCLTPPTTIPTGTWSICWTSSASRPGVGAGAAQPARHLPRIGLGPALGEGRAALGPAELGLQPAGQ